MSSHRLWILSVLAAAAVAHAQPASAPAAPAAMPAAAPATAAPAQPAAAPAAASAEGGKIAYYGRKFAGRKTASGERVNPAAMTMAHKTLPFGTRVKVTNPKNGRSVVLRVNDRGPSTPDRVGDVSVAAARQLGMLRAGVIAAELEVVGKAAAKGSKG
jgi:rare lipoprotein A